ncbi:MAG: hypothetical protein MZV64_42560 [Ignavibacteriales bacterium]|nr:hypothetical protein [Ignavibacteriales bacterium]
MDESPGHGFARRVGLRADIDHPDAAAGVHVRQGRGARRRRLAWSCVCHGGVGPPEGIAGPARVCYPRTTRFSSAISANVTTRRRRSRPAVRGAHRRRTGAGSAASAGATQDERDEHRRAATARPAGRSENGRSGPQSSP